MEVLTCTAIDAARSLGIGKTKLYELIGQGKLKTIKIGRRTLIKADSIRTLVDEAA
ncbi:helix-turn-helix domain-containing protein [Sphingomonas yabuuchiae]|uniref:helix-turn-helix domain-containing protein n=1 Tax=Sphingomonas yabuuchiae TaxID=172044 RepID=UPI003D97C3D7